MTTAGIGILPPFYMVAGSSRGPLPPPPPARRGEAGWIGDSRHPLLAVLLLGLDPHIKWPERGRHHEPMRFGHAVLALMLLVALAVGWSLLAGADSELGKRRVGTALVIPRSSRALARGICRILMPTRSCDSSRRRRRLLPTRLAARRRPSGSDAAAWRSSSSSGAIRLPEPVFVLVLRT